MENSLSGIRIGMALTGSFCTYATIFQKLKELVELSADVTCIFSEHAQSIDTRFGNAKDFLNKAERITKKPVITSFSQAEPLGPKNALDILVLAPCTGNTLAKLANGITDTTALVAAKGHLRNQKPLVLFLSTNDALGMNLKNIGILINTKCIYFVPFGQDAPDKKPNSMISHAHLLTKTIEAALNGKQLQPLIQSPHA